MFDGLISHTGALSTEFSFGKLFTQQSMAGIPYGIAMNCRIYLDGLQFRIWRTLGRVCNFLLIRRMLFACYGDMIDPLSSCDVGNTVALTGVH